MSDKMYWVEMADGSEMGDYAGYMLDSVQDILEHVRMELEYQHDDQADDPDGAHVVGVRLRVATVVEEQVFETVDAAEKWVNRA